MMTNRNFGVEIEIGNRNVNQMTEILRNAGFNVFNQENRSLNNGTQMLTSATRRAGETLPEYETAWKVIYDGSVGDGCEVVSPILSGRNGLEAVKGVIKAMNKDGAKADHRCGLHVHVDANDLHMVELLNVARRYAAFESTIDSFVKPSRRANENGYCKSMEMVVDAMEKNFFSNDKNYLKTLGDRYFKLNLQAYLRHGTVEFRQLEGTTSWTKITNWIEFCVSFVEASRLDTETVNSFVAKSVETWNKIPEEFRKFIGFRRVDSWDVAYLLKIYEHQIPQVIANLNNVVPGAFERVPGYSNVWKVNLSFGKVAFPEMVGTWDKGVPPNVVAHLHNIARTHTSPPASVSSR